MDQINLGEKSFTKETTQRKIIRDNTFSFPELEEDLSRQLGRSREITFISDFSYGFRDFEEQPWTLVGTVSH